MNNFFWILKQEMFYSVEFNNYDKLRKNRVIYEMVQLR